ncbi:MAG: 2,3-bisphosphoglycerate-independent phosphoglycerate mutase [Candidatus Doudnabacteria bacterium]|nr:2,3-bisphosphoglycerate-independent phosphoglycerate mutase [Candidatus Doudnabacteria bacterium]
METNQTSRPKPLVLISMDGVGVAGPGPGNAVTSANTPNLDKFWPEYPHTYLEAAGINVGLPQGVDGNSEVGHMTMGAGKIIFQDLPRIDNSISNGSFFANPELKSAFAHAKKHKSNVHVIGLVSSGKVHASLDHLNAVIKMASQEGCDPDCFFVHAITDGRDSSPKTSKEYLEKITAECSRFRMGRIASVVGRYFAMDRDQRWERIEVAYRMLTEGKGNIVTDISKMIDTSYAQGKTDEFMEPALIVLHANDQPVMIHNNDAVIFTNFRPDRAIELTRAFVEDDFIGFERDKLENLFFVGLAEYDKGLPEHVAFPPEEMENYLGKVLSDNKLKQLRVAESEKFPHVTYFFNAGHQTILPGEVHLEVPSPKDISTFDQKPEMSQRWVTDILLQKLDTQEFDFALINFAGPDMVAHTGVIEATIKSMEVVDECMGRIIEKVLSMNGAVILTADHGNAEEMLNLQTGEPDTKHSVNPVPVIIIQKDLKPRELLVGNLSDIAPTILALLGLEKPAEMTGRNLLA